MSGDVLSLEGDTQAGETLIVPVMRKGKRIGAAPTLGQIRERATRELARLPDAHRRLEKAEDYAVRVSDKLKTLAAQVDKTARR
jgi:nicotinate phosphoribosyltransferase